MSSTAQAAQQALCHNASFGQDCKSMGYRVAAASREGAGDIDGVTIA